MSFERALLGVSFLLVACGGGENVALDATFSGTPFSLVKSDSGALTVEVRSSPSPVVRGVDAFELTVKNAGGAPVDGLTVAMDPWMASHGHGSSVTPEVTAQGAGKYVVKNVSLFMPGRWELRTDFAGPVQDHATISVDVP